MGPRFNVGDRVMVEISKPEEWSNDIAESIVGAVGVVEDVSLVNYLGNPKEIPYLVRFDVPVERRDHGGNHKAFWFAARDLKAVAS